MTHESKQQRSRYLEEIHRLSLELKVMTEVCGFWKELAELKNEFLSEMRAKYEGEQWNNPISSH